MITKLHQAADFAKAGREISREYLESIFAGSPKYLLDIVVQVVEVLLEKIHVPGEESSRLVSQIKEKEMGRLFENFEPYDLQETRRVAREEGKGRRKNRRKGRGPRRNAD